MAAAADSARRYLAASSLPGVEPLFDDFAIGHPIAMGIEEPFFHARLRQIRERLGVAPVWNIKGLNKAWAITRFDDVAAAFLDTRTFSPEATQELHTFPFMGEQMLGFEGRKHHEFRKVVFPAFGKRAVASYEGALRRHAHAVVDGFAARGEADLMQDFAKRYPLVVINEIMGLPVDDWERLAGWARDIILAEHAKRRVAAAAFRAFVAPLLEERRAHPGGDVLSRLVTGQVEGRPLSDEEIVSFLLLLFPAGVDTTWLSLGSLLGAVLSTPGALERTLASAEERHWAIEETLRWEPPTPGIPRVTRREAEVAGVRIPAGALTVLSLAAANREPGRFGTSDPDRWDLDRRPVGHIAFSVGEHFCLGVHLARAELRVGFEVLLERLPGLRLIEPPVFVGAAVRGPRAVRVRWDAARAQRG
jgi:cytochrome P450